VLKFSDLLAISALMQWTTEKGGNSSQMSLLNENYVNKKASQCKKKEGKVKEPDSNESQNVEEQIALFADIIIDQLLKDLYDNAEE
jgi:hypothetical protein